MTRNPFRLLRALRGACPTGARVASRFAPGGLAWLAPLLLGPACALALDIGEIQVHSALNQLFDARIPLPTLAPEELGKISVKLAPTPMFKEFKLERAPVLTNLVFSVEYNAEGQVYVKVVSTKPIQEPSLGLLVEFAWPRGKTFREFTVFLDPVKRLAQRPGDRSKTVLNALAAAPPPSVQPVPPPVAAAPPVEAVPPTVTPAPPVEAVPPTVAPAPPVEAVPPTVVAASEPSMPDTPAGDSAKPEAVAATETEGAKASAESPLPVEAPSPATVRVYRPGDTYGPVAEGEGLWGIALKVRPDPGITRDHMMQALFRANPDAFSKAGVSGLQTGAMLRLPSFREIADITGSATARQLAGVEQQSAVAAATPPSPTPVATESPTSKAVANALEVFLLEPPAPLEPIVVVAPPPEPVAATQEPVAPVAEPVVVKPEPVPPESERTAATQEPVAPVAEPVVASPEPTTPESAALPVAAEVEPAQEEMLEPVSVTPLLFLAVTEMIATLAQPPATTMVSEVETVTLEPQQEASAAPESSAVVSEVEASMPALNVTLEPPVAPMNATASLTAVEQPSPRMEQWDWLLQMQTDLASDVPAPMVAGLAESLPQTPVISASTITPPAATIEEVPTPLVSDSPPLSATGPVEPPAEVVAPTPQPSQDSDSYGPVASNERLWNIAAKVRPDPGISKEHMMKALFKTNPQAFSKPNSMDSLKVGATLRIPTLQEIVEHTGSKAARQLLEQQQIPPTPAPLAEPVAPAVPVTETLPVPEPALPAAETAPPALESAAPAAETPAAPEPTSPLEPAAETPPAPEPTTPPALEPTAPDAEAPPAGETPSTN